MDIRGREKGGCEILERGKENGDVRDGNVDIFGNVAKESRVQLSGSVALRMGILGIVLVAAGNDRCVLRFLGVNELVAEDLCGDPDLERGRNWN